MRPQPLPAPEDKRLRVCFDPDFASLEYEEFIIRRLESNPHIVFCVEGHVDVILASTPPVHDPGMTMTIVIVKPRSVAAVNYAIEWLALTPARIRVMSPELAVSELARMALLLQGSEEVLVRESEPQAVVTLRREEPVAA